MNHFLCSSPLSCAENDVVLTHNKSGRFESRFVSVRIQESASVWLRGMEGSALGVWVAHGEGTTFKLYQNQLSPQGKLLFGVTPTPI